MPVMAALPFIMAGTALAGSMMQSQAVRQQGAAESTAYQYNAAVNEADAKATADKAAYDEETQRNEAAALSARQRVLYAKGGVDLSVGSPLLVMSSDAAQAEKDALAIRYQGAVDQTKYKNQAQLNRFYGETAEDTAETKANATLLSGIGNAGMSYAMGKGGFRK